MSNPVADEVIVTAVQFGDEGVEISYFEKRDQGNKVGVFKTMVMSTVGLEEQIEEINDSILELIDHGALTLRNPPDRISGARRRILDRDEAPESSEG